MAKINAKTTGGGGIETVGDASGVLELQSGGTTIINATTVSGNPRITGDFSNATVANRVSFQTSTVNGSTDLAIIPNGTSPQTVFRAFNTADPTNSSCLALLANNTETSIRSTITGTGSFLPLTFFNGGIERARIDTSGNFLFNSGYGSVATAYGCRAWVNFNGTGTVAIRASGNVSSITDGGTGIYTVNFTNALPDANYETNAITSDDASAAAFVYLSGTTGSASTTSIIIRVVNTGGTPVDRTTVAVSIFR
jgi:hypothetical protein